jgi:hypothetical protein
MPPETTEIEVEVLEIDGVAPTTPPGSDTAIRPSPAAGQDGRNWHGSVGGLGSRWWPLWVVLGIIAVGLALTVGLVLGVVFLIARVILKIVRAIVG